MARGALVHFILHFLAGQHAYERGIPHLRTVARGFEFAETLSLYPLPAFTALEDTKGEVDTIEEAAAGSGPALVFVSTKKSCRGKAVSTPRQSTHDGTRSLAGAFGE